MCRRPQAAPPGGVGPGGTRGAVSRLLEGGARVACTGGTARGGFKTALAPTRARRASESEAAPHGREAVRRLASLKGAAGVRCARTDSERLGARGSARPWVSDDRRPRRPTPCQRDRCCEARALWEAWVDRAPHDFVDTVDGFATRRKRLGASQRVQRAPVARLCFGRARAAGGPAHHGRFAWPQPGRHPVFVSPSRPQIGVSDGRTSRSGGSRPWHGRGVETVGTLDFSALRAARGQRVFSGTEWTLCAPRRTDGWPRPRSVRCRRRARLTLAFRLPH